MRVVLHNFRCYDDADFNFEDGLFHYIGGDTGRGKTTIFESILWCLFGKIQGVNPIGDKLAATIVTLEHQNVTIVRRRNPTVLTLSDEIGQTFHDLSAQEEIFKRYGHMQAWLASSYARQGERHILFSSSSQERVKILNQIAFQGDDPRPIIDKIHLKIRETDAVLKSISQQHQAALAIFNNLKEQGQGQIDRRFALDGETADSMAKQLGALDFSVANLRVQRDKTQRALTMEKCYRDIQVQIDAELEALGPVNPTQLAELLDAKQRYDRYTQRQRLIDHHRASMVKMEAEFNGQIPPPQFEPVQLSDAITQFRYNAEMRKRALLVGLEYDPVVISEEIEVLKASIDSQWMFPIIEKYNERKIEFETLEAKVSKAITPELVQKLQDEVAQLERSRNILACPGCQTGLRYMGDSLALAEGTVFDPVKYQRLKNGLDNAGKHLAAMKRMEDLERQMVEIDLPFVPSKARRLQSLEGSRSKLSQMEQIVYVAIPEHDPVFIQACIGWHDLKAKVVELEQDSSSPQPVDNSLIEEITLKSARYRLLCKRKDDNVKVLEELPPQELSVEELDVQIKESLTAQTNIREALSRNTITHQAIAQYREVVRLHNEMGRFHQEHVDLQDMKRIAIEVQHDKLHQMVDSINTYLLGSSRNLFESPIRIEIKLSEKTKKGVEKPCVKVSVGYKGEIFPKLDGLCGGEKSRISLLLTMAMNRAAGSSLLFLDESLASLNADRKDDAIELLACSIEGKTVLMTSHDTPTGHFDQVLSL